jgi:hypothetical protein
LVEEGSDISALWASFSDSICSRDGEDEEGSANESSAGVLATGCFGKSGRGFRSGIVNSSPATTSEIVNLY